MMEWAVGFAVGYVIGVLVGWFCKKEMDASE